MDDDVVEPGAESVEKPIEDLELPRLIVATYHDEASAQAAFDALRNLQKDRQVLLADIAIVMRDNDNTLHINEPDDMAAPEGALYGGTIGAIVGMIAGPLGLAIGGALGAMIGGAAAQTVDADADDAWLREIGEALPPGAGLVVAVAPGIAASQVGAFLTAQGGKVMTRIIDPDMANEMGMPELEPPVDEDPDWLSR